MTEILHAPKSETKKKRKEIESAEKNVLFFIGAIHTSTDVYSQHIYRGCMVSSTVYTSADTLVLFVKFC